MVNEEVAPTVRQIFAWHAEGVSVVQIARRLNDAGIPSPSAYLYRTGEVKTEKYNGVLWNNFALKNLLSHPVYLGHMVQGRKKQSFYEGKPQAYTPESEWKVVRDTHEPIIDAETFEKVQAVMRQRKDEYHERLGKYSYLEHSDNLLHGLVYCPCCNRPMVRYKNVSHEKKLWYTFICPGHADDPARCSFVSIREDELLDVLLSTIKKQIALAVDMEHRTRELNASPAYKKTRSEAQTKYEAAQRTLKRSQSLYDSLYQSYVEQLMTEQEYVTLKARYKAEADEAEQLIATLEQERQIMKATTPQNRFLAEFQTYCGTETITREMVCALVERIYVSDDKSIDICFRYRDEFKVILDYVEGRASV